MTFDQSTIQIQKRKYRNTNTQIHVAHKRGDAITLLTFVGRGLDEYNAAAAAAAAAELMSITS